MQRHIYLTAQERSGESSASEKTPPAAHENSGWYKIYFDTGLDSRSFARTKMSQNLIEPGFIVSANGTCNEWKAAGVIEENGIMKVWGQLVPGKRLDILIEESDLNTPQTRQAALRAVVSWIRAKLFLGDLQSAPNLGASFILNDGVFFAPEHIASRCLFTEDSNPDHFNCPDLNGINAAAFCAGVMLYKILTGSLPFQSAEIDQDMREGIFLPPSLAAPKLNEKLAELIHSALLLPVNKTTTSKNSILRGDSRGTGILTRILETLQADKTGTGSLASSKPAVNTIDVNSLFVPLSEEKKVIIEKEKKNYLLKQNLITGTKRFVTRNKNALLGAGAGLIFIIVIILSVIQSISSRPTTEGLTSAGVITAYYGAFSNLDHVFMEACVQGADKSDINAAASFFAVTKARQAYEYTTEKILFPADEWLENGGELPAPNVFGVTDLTIENVSGSENENVTIYRVNYLLWAPFEQSISRADTLTLRRDKRNNWRIIEIKRIER